MAGIAAILCLLFSLLPLASTEAIYYITPTPETPCHHTDCYTLSEVLGDTDRYFNTSTKLVFHPGKHILDTGAVFLEDFGSVVWQGNSQSLPNLTSKIECSQSSAIVFVNVTIVEINALMFSSCGDHNTSMILSNITGTYLPTITAMFIPVLLVHNCVMQYCHLPLFLFESTLDCHNSSFEYNQGENGGAILAYNGIAHFFGQIVLHGNNASGEGGGVYAESSVLVLQGISRFTNNFAPTGGAISALTSHIDFEIGAGKVEHGECIHFLPRETVEHNQNSHRRDGYEYCSLNSSFSCTTYFEQNSAHSGGAISAAYNSTITFMGQVTFKDNSAESGGGIEVHDYSEVNFKGQTIFLENSAMSDGGGVSCYYTGIVTFSGSRNMFLGNRADRGGGIDLHTGCTLHFLGNGCFVSNSGYHSGGAISATESKITLTGNFSFSNNSAYEGGAVYGAQSEITLDGMHNFTGNTAEDQVLRGYGGGIYAILSKLTFIGQQRFINNSASDGGALAIDLSEPGKVLYLSDNTSVYFISNYAWHKGEAVIVHDTSAAYCLYYKVTYCFIQRPVFNSCEKENMYTSTVLRVIQNHTYSKFFPHNTNIIFENNFSEQGGDNLYGGELELCSICYNSSFYLLGSIMFSYLTGVPLKQYSGKPLISSDPFRVCICNNSSESNCSVTSLNYSLYPGETIYITVAAVGQFNGTVSAVVHAQLEGAKVDQFQTTQQVNKTCSTLQYRLTKEISARSNEATLTLYVEGSCQTLGNAISVYITLLPCPYGFSLSQPGVCICENRLQTFTDSCDITNRSISRTENFWVGFDEQSHGLILHPHCPFDYCRLEAVSFTLNSTDMQCAHSRSGILCGSCKPGLSLNLGSSRCSDCSNSHAFIFFITALSGFLLVIFLFVFRVTVTDGTTSGLIFYANVILVNRNIFYLSTNTNVLTVFIAWLNLDLGIQTCLFHGMDAYIRTWLQFVFPLYIWLLVGLITLASRYSMTVAKIIGPTNPVSVLATLFLLSYTKLLRTIIATLAFTTLEYPDDKSVVVWAYDGNIPYLEGKHIPLLIVGVLSSIFFFLPYTLLLLFGQCILAASNHRLVSWATNPKVRFFLETYHAPYKNLQHRYWVGLLLLVRFIVFIIFVTVDINAPRDPSTNLLVLIVTCAGILMWGFITGNVYKKMYNNILEACFIVNLTILTAVSYQVMVEGGRREVAVYLSMSVAFVTFLGIITYHVGQQLVSTRIWRHSIKPAVHQIRLQLFHRHGHEEEPPVELQLAVPPVAQPQPVPTTFIELREPLLESQQ